MQVYFHLLLKPVLNFLIGQQFSGKPKPVSALPSSSLQVFVFWPLEIGFWTTETGFDVCGSLTNYVARLAITNDQVKPKQTKTGILGLFLDDQNRFRPFHLHLCKLHIFSNVGNYFRLKQNLINFVLALVLALQLRFLK